MKLANSIEVLPAVDQTDAQVADGLLEEHWHWSRHWRPNLGVPSVAPYCTQAVSSRQWDSTTDASCGALDDERLEAVEWCLDTLSGPLRGAIGVEMRNRVVGMKIWRQPDGAVYADALNAAVVVMRARGLLG